MSTAAAGARREFWPWLGHNAWRLSFVVNAILVATVFWQSSPWIAAVILALILVFAAAQQRHDRSLCEHCIAHMPLDPQTEIIKRDRWLRANHVGEATSRKWASLIFAVLSLSYVGVLVFAPRPVGGAVIVLVIGILGPLATIGIQIHKRLQPWCPYCRRNDGGDYQFDPNPTPARSKELT